MRYEEFLKQVELRVQKKMGKEVRIRICPVTKNNAIVLDGLSIIRNGENISPAIYLNAFYQEYNSGETLDHIIDKILCCYERGRMLHNIDTSFYTDFNKVKKKLVCRLVNLEQNQKLLEDVPYRRFLNLAIVYYYLMDQSEIGSATILVRHDHLKTWGVTQEEVDKIALENTPRLLPWDFLSMSDMIQSMMIGRTYQDEKEEQNCLREAAAIVKEIEEMKDEPPLYVLSNTEKNFGAVCMIYDKILEKVAELLKGDFYILPSSVHECMIVPVEADSNEEELQAMVQDINETQVPPEEILSNSVYRYYSSQKRIGIIR